MRLKHSQIQGLFNLQTKKILVHVHMACGDLGPVRHRAKDQGTCCGQSDAIQMQCCPLRAVLVPRKLAMSRPMHLEHCDTAYLLDITAREKV